MKFFYILANQFVTILLSANTVTTLTFNNNEIVNCDYGVSKEVLDFKYRRKRTSISFIPKSDGINTNATCYMKNGRIYVFNIKFSKDRTHKNIVVYDAEAKKGGVKVFENEQVRIFDAGKNFYIENKTSKKISINESLIDKTGISSKWSPIYVNGKEIHL